MSLPVFVKIAREHKILSLSDKGPSKDSLYRLFKRDGIEKDTRFLKTAAASRPSSRTTLAVRLHARPASSSSRETPQGLPLRRDRRPLPTHHQRPFLPRREPRVLPRLPHRRLEKRGLPRRLYVDNGSAFRSNALKYACARLGVALLHSRPYIPQGRGKIERFFRTVRMQFLPPSRTSSPSSGSTSSCANGSTASITAASIPRQAKRPSSAISPRSTSCAPRPRTSATTSASRPAQGRQGSHRHPRRPQLRGSRRPHGPDRHPPLPRARS